MFLATSQKRCSLAPRPPATAARQSRSRADAGPTGRCAACPAPGRRPARRWAERLEIFVSGMSAPKAAAVRRPPPRGGQAKWQSHISLSADMPIVHRREQGGGAVSFRGYLARSPACGCLGLGSRSRFHQLGQVHLGRRRCVRQIVLEAGKARPGLALAIAPRAGAASCTLLKNTAPAQNWNDVHCAAFLAAAAEAEAEAVWVDTLLD